MNNSMQHGGPDDEGVITFPESALSLGNRRLSILDLTSAGHQPMEDSHFNIWITFNGEIFNFLDLRKTLHELGHSFLTSTDTEVIIKAYIQWGESSFGKLNGMFSFSIFDKNKGLLYVVRDSVGIKPLYYYYKNETLVFASEIRAFHALPFHFQEDPDWKVFFLMFGYVPEPLTTLQNVRMLPAGHFIKINVDHHHLSLLSFRPSLPEFSVFSKEEAVALIRQNLIAAVDRHLISDAPIGVFLSGGIDSSILAMVSSIFCNKKDLITISSVFQEGDFNESRPQELVQRKINSNHHSFLTTSSDFIKGFPDLLQAYDQPSVDGINSYFISKYASQIGLKAVLSGLGADELFGGYPSFRKNYRIENIRNLPFLMNNIWKNNSNFKYKKLEYLKVNDEIYRYLVNRAIFSPSAISKILDIPEQDIYKKLEAFYIDDIVKGMDTFDKTSWMETNMYMKNQLLKDSDYMSMWHSLELRVPFLDQEFMNAVSAISPVLKGAKSNRPKDLLVSAFEDILPREVWDRPKKGFALPLQQWLKNTAIVDEMINSDNPYTVQLTKLFLQDRLEWSRFWSLYIMNLFEKKQSHARTGNLEDVVA